MTVYPISQTYGGYPVRGYLYVPDGGASVRDAVVLFHGTIEESGVTPLDSAQKFLQLVVDPNIVNIGDRIIFSVAYPQDAIPGWTQTQASGLFPGINLSTLYFGDNLVYVSAALQWAINSLNTYLTSLGTGKTRNRIFTFGHSQGAYLVHLLNRMHTVDGVISNAPGPIDFLTRCQASEAAGDNNAQCSKIKLTYGSTVSNPTAYSSRSMQTYLDNTLAPAFFIQGLADPGGIVNGVPQVGNMIQIVKPGLDACTTCHGFIFGFYTKASHEAFAQNPLTQADIREFLTSLTITDHSSPNQPKYTFGWTPSYAPTESQAPKVRQDQLKTSFHLRANPGLNSNPSEWSLTFNARTDDETNAITTFLDFHTGAVSFNWTPPRGTAGLYVCEKWQVNLDSNDSNTIQATFREVFEP